MFSFNFFEDISNCNSYCCNSCSKRICIRRLLDRDSIAKLIKEWLSKCDKLRPIDTTQILCDKARQALEKTAEREKKKIDERKLRVIMESEPNLKSDLADAYEHLKKAKIIIEENSAKMQEIERKSSQKGDINTTKAASETHGLLDTLTQYIAIGMDQLVPGTTS